MSNSNTKQKFDLSNISTKGLIAVIGLMIFNLTLRALVLAKIWEWFIVRLFNAPVIGVTGAMGICIFIRLAFDSLPRPKDIENVSRENKDEDESIAFTEQQTWSIIHMQEMSMATKALICFALAYVVQLFL